MSPLILSKSSWASFSPLHLKPWAPRPSVSQMSSVWRLA